YALPDDDPAEWHVAGGDSFREGEEVGLDPVVLRAEPLAQAAEARDHLVEHEQDVVLATEPLDGGPVAVRRRVDAAGADHRLAQEGSNVAAGEDRGNGVDVVVGHVLEPG